MRRMTSAAVFVLLGALAARLWNPPPEPAMAAQQRIYTAPGDVDGDGGLGLSDVIYLLVCMFSPERCPDGLAHCPPGGGACGVLQTGQTEVWWPVYPFHLMDPPPTPSQGGYGQDGSYQAGMPRVFEVIEEVPDDEMTWMVVDHTLGLMWEFQPRVMRIPWAQALDYCEMLDLGGFTDWRLPNIRELETLVDYSRTEPAMDEDSFYWEAAEYWSSTSYTADPGQAWIVHFHDGRRILASKFGGSDFYVRAVRTMP